MFKKLIAKWSLLASGAALAAVTVPGCEEITQLIEQLLGTVTGA
jgi:hypothetical protein